MENTDKDKLLDANKNLEALKKQIEQLEDKIENYEHNENALLQDKENSTNYMKLDILTLMEK